MYVLGAIKVIFFLSTLFGREIWIVWKKWEEKERRNQWPASPTFFRQFSGASESHLSGFALGYKNGAFWRSILRTLRALLIATLVGTMEAIWNRGFKGLNYLRFNRLEVSLDL